MFFRRRGEVVDYFEEVKFYAKLNDIEFGQFHAPFPSYYYNDETASNRAFEAIIKSIKITSFCNCKYIIIHPCFNAEIQNSLSKEEEWEVNINFYSSLIPYLKEHKVICCLENMWCYDRENSKKYSAICSNPYEAKRYIDALNEIAGEELFAFCLDTGHLLLVGADPYHFIKTLGGRLKTLHINDNDGLGDLHLCPYMGVGNWDRLCEALKEVCYQGTLNFETATTQRRFHPQLIQPVLNLIGEVALLFTNILEEKS
ncbi:MAG TPA: sugar phosphate isomerase/epimerase [Acholeplasmataceae bacterium]|nr:sugar phosphate isomerase/epimerase [Acholeplasmataceae bacterium]